MLSWIVKNKKIAKSQIKNLGKIEKTYFMILSNQPFKVRIGLLRVRTLINLNKFEFILM